jgi:plasmid stabilization system protein ParE
VRWQQLFADLDAQFEQAETVAERSESGSRARAEVGELLLVDRLRGAVDSHVVVHVRGAGRCAGVVVDVGPDWLLLLDGRGDVLVATRAVSSVGGLGRRTGAAPARGAVRARLDLRRALRALARDRATVQVLLDDGAVLVGTVDRVGADFLELAEHPADAPRRAEAVQGVRAVALGAVAVVRTVLAGA